MTESSLGTTCTPRFPPLPDAKSPRTLHGIPKNNVDRKDRDHEATNGQFPKEVQEPNVAPSAQIRPNTYGHQGGERGEDSFQAQIDRPATAIPEHEVAVAIQVVVLQQA